MGIAALNELTDQYVTAGLSSSQMRRWMNTTARNAKRLGRNATEYRDMMVANAQVRMGV